MRRILTAIAIASLGSAPFMLAQAQTQSPGTQKPPGATMPPSAAPGAPATRSQAGNAFANQALKSGREEVALSQMAAEKSQNPRVKELAEMLVTDHTAVNAKLSELAGGSSPDRSLQTPGTGPNRSDAPPATTPGAAPMSPDAKRLSGLSGAAFDQAWLDAIIKGHRNSVALYTAQAQRGTDPAAKALAAETLPKIKQHLQMAQALRGQPARAMPPATQPGAPPSDTGRQSPGTGDDQEVPGAAPKQQLPGTDKGPSGPSR